MFTLKRPVFRWSLSIGLVSFLKINSAFACGAADPVWTSPTGSCKDHYEDCVASCESTATCCGSFTFGTPAYTSCMTNCATSCRVGYVACFGPTPGVTPGAPGGPATPGTLGSVDSHSFYEGYMAFESHK